MDWRPSLLLLDPALSKRARALWSASNYRGVWVPGPGGELRELACPKAIYAETEVALDAWGEESLRIVLLPTTGLQIVSEQVIAAVSVTLPQNPPVQYRSQSGEDHENNLITLFRECHSRIHET